MELAHGVATTGDSVGAFVWSGFIHMISGWDHLLFLAGIVLITSQVRATVKLVSLFALGHSTTLIVATLAGWQFPPTIVDIVIALSLAYVGAAGFVDLDRHRRWIAAYVLGFGLVHGLGLATRLQTLGLPEGGSLPRVLAFNVGVEIGQLLAVGGMFMLGDVLRHYITWRHTRPAAHAGLIVVGVSAAATMWLTTPLIPDWQRQAAVIPHPYR
ncbi:HupE/UreJ family protein [Asanoa iriomotensis]|uniref:HupE/UreJ protein n=1 Tax=Asanoa iriomotensis TaxID=234613 RepID=A0ABQ4BYU8_9ACTN|nr:HupE/UreJ family protein [Asanoa iriomotensis]GIF55700.1 hypothetical protein Air01nite_17950 [Asanoa iriomotensis]